MSTSSGITDSPELEPCYLELHRSGELRARADAALARLESCDICPRECGVNRNKDERQVCETGRRARISSVGPHFGEESPLVGMRGSGTVFFAGCNLNCTFCQNWDISHECHGRDVNPEELAESFLTVQQLGCHNLNLVTPTHVTPQILEALCEAVERGLRLPIVYNCGGYESLETLKLLDGVVDIYMPDLKYMDQEPARRYSDAEDYPEVARAAFAEMHRQVGDLKIDEQGVALRGMLVRHLVLPDGMASTKKAMEFLAKDISTETYVNVMDQYRPCGTVRGDDSLGRRVTRSEYDAAVQTALEAGLSRLDDRTAVRILRFW